MHAPVSQTRSFTTVFLIEMWERFGYYGMAALLVLFMVDRLGFTDSHANLTWGAFTALVYASPSIGGWIGDKVLGARRTMIIGAAVLCAGYLMLAFPNDALSYMYASLGVIVVGNGLFKANAANLVRRIYEGDDARIDSAFTIYYMAVNIGSTVSMLATPWIKDHWGWHAAFAVCCAGMLLAILNFMLMHRTLAHIGSQPDDQPIRWKRLGGVAAGGVALALATLYVLQHKQLAVASVWTAAFAILAIFGGLFSGPLPTDSLYGQIAQYTPIYGLSQLAHWPLTLTTTGAHDPFRMAWVLNLVVWGLVFVAGAVWRFRRDTERV